MVGGTVASTLTGIAGAAIGYGAGKLIQQGNDRPSWNFSNVASDAFGNALGNSFVANRIDAEQGKLNKARDENTIAQLIKEGATPQQAAAMVAQQYYNRDTANSAHELLAATNVDWADAFSTDEINLSNGADNFKFFTGGVSTAEHANNLLSIVRSTLGNNEFANFSLGYADKALTSKVNSVATLRAAEERGYFNAHQAYTLRKASFTGFDGNMTNADR